MYSIDPKDPIKLKGECMFALSLDSDGNYKIAKYAYDEQDMLSATLEPIQNTPDMSGIVEIFKQKHEENIIVDYGDVFDGKEFLNEVLAGGIMDYDGFIGPIIVDGYSSNLGLFTTDGFNQGRFAVDAKVFEELCKEHDIQVVWHNR